MKTLLLSILGLVPFLTSAQIGNIRATVEWGPEFKSSSILTDYDFQYIGDDLIIHYVEDMSLSWQTHIFQSFDPDLNYKTKADLELKEKGDYLEYNYPIAFGGNFYLYFGKKVKKTYQVYLEELNKETLGLSGNRMTVFEMERKGDLAGYFGGPDIVHAAISPDEKLLCLFHEVPYRATSSEQYVYKIFDQKMAVIREGTLDGPYADEKFLLRSFFVGNDGTISVLGEAYYFDMDAYSHYHLLVYAPGEQTPVNLKLELGAGIEYLKTAQAQNGDFIIGGFYQMGKEFGCYVQRFDLQAKAVAYSTRVPFDLDLLVAGHNAKETERIIGLASQGERLQLHYQLKGLLPRSDGGFYFVGEQYNTEDLRKTAVVLEGTERIGSFYDDVMVVSFDANGKPLWTQKISKHQLTVNDPAEYSSIALKEWNDNLFILFNDHIDNMDYSTGEPTIFDAAAKTSIPMLVSIDSKGNVSRDPLLQENKYEMMLVPKSHADFDEKTLLMYSKKGGTARLAKVVMK